MMIKEIFDINNFNILCDDENYYFFRSLEEVDIESVKNKTITDENGNIKRLITDREFYGETIFKEDDPLTLEQIIEHIKMDYNKHTNCISFSSNANVILDYGRNIYNDKYVMLKVPKSEFGKNVVNAGQYILEEINKKLEEYYKEIDKKSEEYYKKIETTKYFFDAIDNAKDIERLEKVKSMITKDYVDETKNIFVNGIEKIINSQNYDALNEKQNLLKNKIILKMDLLKKPIMNKMGNSFLTTTLGCAFSSLEIIHYNNINENIMEISPEIMDVISLLQQVKETPEILEIKKILLEKINNKEINTSSFNLSKFDVESFKEKLNIPTIYKLTGGNISYKEAKNIYTKAYILAKSRLRKKQSLDLLKNILNDTKYDNAIEYLNKNTYGIESEITNRISNEDSINLSESVNLLIREEEQNILDYINNLNLVQVVDLLNNPLDELQNFIEDNYTDNYILENWLANSIIDLIDWDYYGIKENLSEGQRELLIQNLKENNFIEKYNNLKKHNLSDIEIANGIIFQIIRNTDEIDVNEKITLSELEDFLGCNQIKDTGIKLKTYQKEAIKNINKNFSEKGYASVILPTGTGKSYVALAEMHYIETEIKKLEENRHAKILYLAPNNFILDQLQRIIVRNYRDNFVDSDEKIVQKVFPNLTLATYSYLTAGTNSDKIINDKYDLIVFDELHRTGASEWGKKIDELLEDQPAKVLGITATPERDVDGKDMSEVFAKKYGYTDDEILEQKHLAYNMDILEAIKRGIIHNPKVINCEYSLIKDGSLEELKLGIDAIKDENLQNEKRKEYEALRKEVANADGIEKILKENLKKDGKYIVFIPLSKNEKGNYINTESNEEVTESQAQRMIKSYQDLMNQFLFSGEYLEKHKDRLLEIYNKINSNIKIDENDINYLNNEKENIQLLTKLHINNCPSELQTLSNDMAIKIINYMNWEVLEDTKITSILNTKMKHEVEAYNMISDNSKKHNDRELANFNSSQSSKKKFMFVMDMLNEGVHVDRIDGIIWFRPLNEDSKILFLQQLGRCISAIGEDNLDKIPTVIDLVNNTLKVDILKNVKKEKDDLIKIIEVSKWIEINGMPNINSKDKEALENLKILKTIQSEYQSFLNEEKLENQKLERKILIEKIISIGSEFNLWNYEFLKSTSDNEKEKGTAKEKDNLLSIFSIKGTLRRFSELYDEVEKNNEMSPDKYVDLIKKYCEEYKEWPNMSKESKVNQVEGKTGCQLSNWLHKSGYNQGEFKYGPELKSKIDTLNDQYNISTEAKYVDLIEKYCEEYKEWASYSKESKSNKIKGKTGYQLAEWLNDSGYNQGEFKYDSKLKERLDKLKNQYNVSPETKYVNLIEKYCRQYKKWPSQSKEDKKNQIEGKTGFQLAQWLNSSGYNQGEFKYDSKLKERLDKLKNQYNVSPETKYVVLIEKYCRQYKKWPNMKKESKENKIKGKTGKQLADWLNTSGYNKGEFKYGPELKSQLDKLKNQYTILPGTKQVDLIEKYCKKYEEWPSYSKESEANKMAGQTGKQLAKWLIKSGYNKGEFKYAPELKSQLDKLKEQYNPKKVKYDKLDEATNVDSHFKKVVDNLENKKKNNEEDNNGKSLY